MTTKSDQEKLAGVRTFTSAQRVGSCYFELLPGTFSGRYWTEHSLLIDDRCFEFFLDFITELIPRFDYYDKTQLDYGECIALAQSLEDFAQTAEDLTRAPWPIIDAEVDLPDLNASEVRRIKVAEHTQLFARRFDVAPASCAQAFSELAKAIARFIRVQVSEHGTLCILGM